MDTQSDCTEAESLHSNTNKTAASSPNVNKRIDYDQYDLSPIDLEIQIQTERINSIFTEITSKTEIVIAFLLIDQEEMLNILETALTNDEFTFVKINLVKFNKSRLDETLQSVLVYMPVTKEEIQDIITQPVPMLHFELSQIIHIVFKYPELHKKIIECIQYDSGSAHFLILYLDSLCRLQTRVIEKLTINAGDKLKKKVMLRNLSKTHYALKIKIADANNKLKYENDNFDRKFQVKNMEMNKLQKEADSLLAESKEIIKMKILDAEKQMLSAKHLHDEKYEVLKENDAETTKSYTSLLNDNMENENLLRGLRLKVESQLLNWVQKYDQEIGSKQAELDDLTENYEDEKLQLENLQDKFETQESMYVPLMAEKEAEYQQEILNKMTTFLMEHAARVIQRAWRQILATRAEKKRQKRLASKKKKPKDPVEK